MKFNKFGVRVLSLILTISILVGITPISVFSTQLFSPVTSNDANASEDHDKVVLLHEGAKKVSVNLPKDGEETLTAFISDINPTNMSWQILIPDSNTWVNIQGQNNTELKVSYSIVGSMLNSSERAYIRAVARAGEKDYFSDSIEISVVHSVDTSEADWPAMLAMSNRGAAVAADEGDLETFTIVINYIFDNGGIAFEPYGASVAKGSDFEKTVPSPGVIGYSPFRLVDGVYVDASEVELNLTNISENTTINVIYRPAMVDFQIHHHLQDLYDDDFPVQPDIITYSKGLTGSTVPTGLQLTEYELPGFSALAYEFMTIAADGSTVVEIRYNRNYYLVNFDMDGGYGTEPVYVKYGSLVGANKPIRHGYVFDGWELVSYGDQAPTTEQASMYDINSTTITVPSANLTYRARWITQLTSYTMVFWKENINDNGFTYWGSLNSLAAMSGDSVSGADRIGEINGIDDEDCFTYNDALTDKNVIVEGDGSSIVNVYYTRNRYTITFKAPGLCVIPTGHSHSSACYQLLCTKGHTHTDECTASLTCATAEHTAHTNACIICGKSEHNHSSSCCGLSEHTHVKACYNNIGNSASPSGAPTNVANGYIFSTSSGWRATYYIYIAGTWYRYNGQNVSNGDIVVSSCGKTQHTHGTADCSCSIEVHNHTTSCYRDVIHTHDKEKCYTYSCGQVGHVHENGCSILHCPIPEGHSHSTTCKNSSSTNTVKLEYRKYQDNLEGIWPITDDNGVVYNSGERWEPSSSNTYSAVLVYIANMPGEDFTLTLNKSNNDTYTMNYYLEVLEGEAYDHSYGGKNYALYTQVKANYNYLTSAEDFFNIAGFYQLTSNPAFSNGQIDINGGGTVNFYYGRITDHELKFQSNGSVLNDKTQTNFPYGQSLKKYYFEPEYPESLEPGAYVFAGWYTSPGHYDGTEVDWDTATMDAGDVMFYAKWAPVTHSVSVYLDNSLSQQIGSSQLVSHGNFASSPTETISNGNYIFQGWFYLDTENGQTVEKAFVFTGIPVLDDMKIYAKWSSHVTVNYTINYVLFSNKEPIADPTVGSAIAGHNKTFYAKTGSDLYQGFGEGYYPLTSSHTVTMSAEADHEFTFEYVYVESMPYLVRYIDDQGNKVAEDKLVSNNNLSVVTETFIKIQGMMPDAYQKRLVLSASNEDNDGDGVYDSNVITFTYSSDPEHAYYRVVHYLETISGDGYREYRSEDAVGIIGDNYSVSALNITGFSLNGQITKVNNTLHPIDGDSVTAELTAEGLLIELYYDRVDVGYTVRYLEVGTNRVLYTAKQGAGIFGEQVVEYAPGLTHLGYSLVSDSAKSLHLAANESSNVIDFYYQETTYSIKYQIVGEGAALSLSSENILAVSGEPTGSVPYVNSGYHFVGWYYDETCLAPVPSEWVDEQTHQIQPRNSGVWLSNHTYYAKIDPDFTSLTINTLGCAGVDEDQIFIFTVRGDSDNCAHINLTITIVGNSAVRVDNLPIGSYTVTELTAWSYRYTPDAITKSITLSINQSSNSLTFSHIRTTTQWLDGNDSEKNDFN